MMQYSSFYSTTVTVLAKTLSPPTLTAFTWYSNCGPRGWSISEISLSIAMATCVHVPNPPLLAGCFYFPERHVAPDVRFILRSTFRPLQPRPPRRSRRYEGRTFGGGVSLSHNSQYDSRSTSDESRIIIPKPAIPVKIKTPPQATTNKTRNARYEIRTSF